MEEERISLLDYVEEMGFEWAGVGILNAVSDIRELNQKWWRDKKITNKDKENYYINRSFILDYLHAEEEDSIHSALLKKSFIKSLAMAAYYSNLKEDNGI